MRKKLKIEPENYAEIMLKKILDENKGVMDANEANDELQTRLFLLKIEVENNDRSLLPTSECDLCKEQLKDRKSITKIIHEIIYHYQIFTKGH